MNELELTKRINQLQDQVRTDGITKKVERNLQRLVWDYFKTNRRDFAWRRTTNPYQIVVSEIMLQQTQTDRVAKKFPQFLRQFPNWKKLAAAPNSMVIQAWQGLGYNRRALALHTIAQKITNEYGGKLPQSATQLETLPGIGANTAGSIMAFAFNAPVVFIETNIRSVFIHLLFSETNNVTDETLWPLITNTLDHKQPRLWYYALMDLGAALKKQFGNPNKRSAHYQKQSTFAGSNRQARGQILAFLSKHPGTLTELQKAIDRPTVLIKKLIEKLNKEGFISRKNKHYYLGSAPIR